MPPLSGGTRTMTSPRGPPGREDSPGRRPRASRRRPGARRRSTGTWFGTTSTCSRRPPPTGRRCWSPRPPGSATASTPSSGRGLEVRLRVRLAPGHRVAGHDARERLGRQRREDRRDEPPVGHRHQGARDLLLAQRPSSSSTRARPPRHLVADPRDDAVEELLDDLRRLEVDAHVLADVAAGLDQVVADQVQGVLVAPACRRTARRARTRRRSSTARCRRACRPCPRGRRAAGGSRPPAQSSGS